MYEAIKNFNQQFLYEPEIVGEENLMKASSFIVVGMGGSALAAKLLKTWKIELDIIIRTVLSCADWQDKYIERDVAII